MKKAMLLIFILLVISIVACQQAVKEESIEKKGEAATKVSETPKVEISGEAVVDAVGNNLNSADGVEKELIADGLSDFDSGLDEIENI